MTNMFEDTGIHILLALKFCSEGLIKTLIEESSI